MTPLENQGPFPHVQGTCPACHVRSLFLASGGYVTCGVLSCPDPCAASAALGVEFPNQAARRATHA